jgi:hypothetical protein
MLTAWYPTLLSVEQKLYNQYGITYYLCAMVSGHGTMQGPANLSIVSAGLSGISLLNGRVRQKELIHIIRMIRSIAINAES